MGIVDSPPAAVNQPVTSDNSDKKLPSSNDKTGENSAPAAVIQTIDSSAKKLPISIVNTGENSDTTAKKSPIQIDHNYGALSGESGQLTQLFDDNALETYIIEEDM